jgi:hypothetical protein
MTWRQKYPKLAWLARQSIVRKCSAILEDTVLVLLAILASKFVGAVIDSLFSGWLRESMQTVKGYGLIILYIAFLCELLERVGFWRLLKRLYNLIVKGHSDGSNTILAA